MNVTTAVPRIARVRMPEKGTFSVRCAESFAAPCGTRVVVNLDYGLDLAELCTVVPFEPARDGPHPPGFTMLRLAGPEDLAAAEANDALAREMRMSFLKAAQRLVPDIRVPYARLSLGGGRLFVRFVCERLRPDLRHVINDFRREHQVG